MRYLSGPVFQEELTDLHIVHATCMFWRMRCLAHRLIEFGWEESVKRLSAPEALCLASIVPPQMHDALVEAAYSIADERWRSFIQRTLPHLVPEHAA